MVHDASTSPFVEVRGASKTFGAIRALQDVSIEFERGQLHGLVGANGAGKSTLIKVLSGIYTPDSGSLLIGGEPVELRNAQDAHRLGLEFVHQELNLVPKFSILQNLALGQWDANKAGMLRWGELRSRAKEVLGTLGLRQSLDTPVGRLSVAEGWLVSIGRGLMREAKLIAMDEPTASLTNEECERLFGVIQNLKESNVAVLYVSHRLHEVVKLSDRVSVFRDGRVVDTLDGSRITRAALVQGITGEGVDIPGANLKQAQARDSRERPVFRAMGVASPPLVNGVDLEVYRGEVLGVTGLVGSGRTEFMRVVFGVDRMTSGKMLLEDKDYSPHSVADAIARGVALVPEERRSQGLFLEKAVDFNIAFATLSRLKSGVLGLIAPQAVSTQAEAMSRSLRIKTPSIKTPVRQLSGGNQQKVVMAKWLAGNCTLLLLDEASRGVDVAARSEIYDVIREQARKGMAVIVVSSEYEELGNCDRVLVMSEGRVVAELKPHELTEARVLAASFGREQDSVESSGTPITESRAK